VNGARCSQPMSTCSRRAPADRRQPPRTTVPYSRSAGAEANSRRMRAPRWRGCGFSHKLSWRTAVSPRRAVAAAQHRGYGLSESARHPASPTQAFQANRRRRRLKMSLASPSETRRSVRIGCSTSERLTCVPGLTARWGATENLGGGPGVVRSGGDLSGFLFGHPRSPRLVRPRRRR